MTTKMLEKAIEIEGLLRIIRDGQPQAETYTMLDKKVKELAEGIEGILSQEESEVIDREIANDKTTEKAEEEELTEEKSEESDMSDLSEHAYSDEDDDILLATSEEEEIEEEAEETPKPKKEKRQVKLKSAFSLNDRYLYARELFEGNMKMFDSTLEFLEGIEEYSIVEDYFYSELEWDPENRHVASFMDILRPYFRE